MRNGEERDISTPNAVTLLPYVTLLSSTLFVSNVINTSSFATRFARRSTDNYKRDDKELKILMATIRRIDKFDCTFLSCKLTNSHIDDNWCSQVASALKGNDFLQQLYLSGNFISDDGVSSLAAVLEGNMAIKILNLAGNIISDDGAYRIGEMLKKNKNLVDLNLEFHAKKRPYRDKDTPYPRITAPGGAMIAFALQNNYSLTSLNLGGQRLWDAGFLAVGSAIRDSKTLKYLNLSGNDAASQGGLGLAAALEVNEHLEHLNVSQNKFKDDVGMKFADALMKNVSLETLDLYENDLTLVSVRELREAAKGSPALRVLSVYGNRGLGKLRNDNELDNLVETNILRYREDKMIKDLVIWHKRLFEKDESRVDYDHFLEYQFGVIKDEFDGTLFDVDISKSNYRDVTANHAQAMGAVSAQPTSPMNNLQMKATDSKVLATAPSRLPELIIDVFKEDMNGETMESRLWSAWQFYTAKMEASASLGGVNVRAYNDSTNPFYDSLTRLMQLRVPIPGRKIQDGTISVCRLHYWKEEEETERKAISSQAWYKKQKEAAMDWKGHNWAMSNLPPDKFVDGQYQEFFPHKYPNGIDAEYNAKQQKVNSMVKGFAHMMGGALLEYKGISEDEKRQRDMDAMMQQMTIDGVDAKDRKIALRKAGMGKVQTSGEREAEASNGPRRMTTRERQRTFSKAHIGLPDFKGRRISVMHGGGLGGESSLSSVSEAPVVKKHFQKPVSRDKKARRGGLIK